MKFTLRAIAVAVVVASGASPVLAAEFTVTPVRIFMTPRDRAIAVTVTNDSEQEIVMQADLYSWKQKADGTDELTSTDEVILSPPILRVPAKSRQVVRLARLGPPPAVEEQTYRMIVREVPEARPQAPGAVGVQLAIAFSLPVFVTPPGAKRQMQCEVARVAPDTANATCRNSGRGYAQIRAFELLETGGTKVATREPGGYILPGNSRTFELKGPGQIPAGPMKLQVGYDDGTTQSFETTLRE
jgi:fimbrial chaperone protein